jgi:hypothetical protein
MKWLELVLSHKLNKHQLSTYNVLGDICTVPFNRRKDKAPGAREDDLERGWGPPTATTVMWLVLLCLPGQMEEAKLG